VMAPGGRTDSPPRLTLLRIERGDDATDDRRIRGGSAVRSASRLHRQGSTGRFASRKARVNRRGHASASAPSRSGEIERSAVID
jgi:hypothetical protein